MQFGAESEILPILKVAERGFSDGHKLLRIFSAVMGECRSDRAGRSGVGAADLSTMEAIARR